MGTTSHEIDSYRVYHHNEDNTYGQAAVINCLKSGVNKATLYFYREGTSIPASAIASNGTIYLRFSERRIHEILDTLRNEKPLHVVFNSSNKWGWLGTTNEPVGEEET